MTQAAYTHVSQRYAQLQVLRPESHPALYSIVLGEGVMNDAASVALLKAVGSLSDSAPLTPATLALLLVFFVYVFAASFALGLLGGLAIASAMKHLGPFSQPQEVRADAWPPCVPRKCVVHVFRRVIWCIFQSACARRRLWQVAR